MGTEVILGFGESERGFPCGSAGKEFACRVGDVSLIPGLGRWALQVERVGYD